MQVVRSKRSEWSGYDESGYERRSAPYELSRVVLGWEDVIPEWEEEKVLRQVANMRRLAARLQEAWANTGFMDDEGFDEEWDDSDPSIIDVELQEVYKVANAIYEQYVGPIPAGFAVGYRDLNPRNISLENLVLVRLQ